MKKNIILSALLSLLSLCVIAAQPARANLTNLLLQIQAQHNIYISFSPTVTDKIYPRVKTLASTPEAALKQVLTGLDLSFKPLKDNHFYVYVTKKKVVPRQPKKPKPEPAKEAVDQSSRFHNVTIDLDTQNDKSAKTRNRKAKKK